MSLAASLIGSRGTIIELLVEPDEGDDHLIFAAAASVNRRARASSAPAEARRSAGGHDGEGARSAPFVQSFDAPSRSDSYCAPLPDTATASGELPELMELSESQDMAEMDSASAASHSAIQQQNAAVSNMLLFARARGVEDADVCMGGVSKCDSAATYLPVESCAASTDGFESSVQHQRSLSSVEEARPPVFTPLALESPAPAENVIADNLGSIGHPFLCSRPCLYFAAGQCTNGPQCEFCHSSHDKRPSHLNKRHREELRALSPQRLKELVLPALKEKVMAFDSSFETEFALEDLVRACGVDRLKSSLPRKDRSLAIALHGMSLRLLLITLQRSALKDEPLALAAADHLLSCLLLRAGAGADVAASLEGRVPTLFTL